MSNSVAHRGSGGGHRSPEQKFDSNYQKAHQVHLAYRFYAIAFYLPL
jgi:hypothetical protein